HSRRLLTRERGAVLRALGALAVCSMLSPWRLGEEMSLVRSLLPETTLRYRMTPPWMLFEVLALLALAFEAWRLARPAKRIPRAEVLLCTLLPLAVSALEARVAPHMPLVSWAACAGAVAAAYLLPEVEEFRGLLLGVAALAFYRSISAPGPWCLLAFSA